LGWVGLGQSANGLGWVGSHKMDPWTTLSDPVLREQSQAATLKYANINTGLSADESVKSTLPPGESL